jgi:isocitrate dehydrogenase
LVNSDKGITNLHVPSDVIVDALCRNDSYFRTNVELRQQTTRHDRMIPDRSYSGVYEATIDFVKEWRFDNNNGKCSKRRFDGTKAEEYGSHDKTFQMTATALFVLQILEMF